ncbi:peptidylprolyl isomerase [Nocardiopsis mwathae]|uniref:peptidylprolyl isomerase n=1 Tax=Nocardiopsis mwathae TaxID=1472723 RepID=A0A7W9YH62_9ACTN|nr:FKBP-type peptidyl-prolyl cis-trans isomerase [Nocardiopsis mwathae]MBB6172047.1 peptidylprolyl isomerase [Nocardiopsis mwathae]
MRRRAAALAVPFSAVLLAMTSCASIPEEWKTPAFLQSDADQKDARLPTVTGEVGTAPEVDFGDKAPPGEQLSGLVEKGPGEGALIRQDDLLQVQIVDYQWTGKGEAEQTQSSYEAGAPVLLKMEEMSDELRKDLVNQPVGSRVVFVFPGQDPDEAAAMGQPEPEPGDSVSVVDVEKRYGKGDVVPGKQTTDGGDGLPTSPDSGPGKPEITIPEDTDPPKKLETVDLVEGDGPEVAKEQQVVVQYTGARWDDGKVFDSTWDRGGIPFTFAIGLEQVIKGWDQGLEGKKVGSRVMLVIPEDLAYGKDAAQTGSPAGTLVFVVDILGAVDSTPPPQAEPEDGADDAKKGDDEQGDDESDDESDEDDGGR